MYLKTLGFNNWEEITKLDLNSQKEFAKKLDKEIENMMIEVKIGGITIHRPKNLRNVRDMSFSIDK